MNDFLKKINFKKIFNKKTLPFVLGGIVLVAILVSCIVIFTNKSTEKDIVMQIESMQSFTPSESPSKSEKIYSIIQTNTTNEVLKKDDLYTVEVTSPDMKAIISEILDSVENSSTETAELTQEELENKVLEKLESGEFELIATSVPLELDDDGNIKDTYELLDASSGGLLSYMDELLKKASSEITESEAQS